MKFKYVQIGAKDYKKLSEFYINVCFFKKAEDQSWLHGREGVVLKALGFEKDNPIYFGFVPASKGNVAQINDVGFAHTCYETVDVCAFIKRLKKFGGSFQSTLKNPEKKPCVYCKDIEGNVVEFHIPFPSKEAKIGLTISSLLGWKKDKAAREDVGESSIKFIHVNMISEDWRSLCDFYNNCLGSTDFGKLKDHSGAFKEKVIGIKDVHVIGQHILIPDYKLSYPTFEIFTYSIKGRKNPCDENSLGINQIGFESKDFKKDLETWAKFGGKILNKNSDFIEMEDIQSDKILIRKI